MATDFYIDNEEGIPTVGDILDLIVRKMNLLGLNDYFMGSYVSYEEQLVQVMFSPFIPPEKLQELINNIDDNDFNIDVEDNDDNYILNVTNKSLADKQGVKPVITGNMNTEVSLEGEIEVQNND